MYLNILALCGEMHTIYTIMPSNTHKSKRRRKHFVYHFSLPKLLIFEGGKKLNIW